MNYTFKYSLTVDEYADYVAFTQWQSPWQKKFRIKYLFNSSIYIIIMMIVGVIAAEKTGPVKKNHNYILLIILFILVLTIALWFVAYNAPFRMKERARKFIAKEENSKGLEEIELDITDENIIYNSVNSKSIINWDYIAKYAITNEYFFLYLNELNAIIIPKRLFNSQEGIDEFQKVLTQKIPLSSSFRSVEYN